MAPARPASRSLQAAHAACLCIAAAFLLAASAARAADAAYPNHPVRIVVPFTAGGSADVYGRYLATRLQQRLGQPFIVDDRPGVGAIIGTDAVAKSPPDGYIAKWARVVQISGAKPDR